MKEQMNIVTIRNDNHDNFQNNPDITNESIESVLKNCSNVKYINFKGCNQLTNTTLLSITKNCPHLESFIFECDKVHTTSDNL